MEQEGELTDKLRQAAEAIVEWWDLGERDDSVMALLAAARLVDGLRAALDEGPDDAAEAELDKRCMCEFPRDYHDPRIEPLKECTYHGGLRASLTAAQSRIAELEAGLRGIHTIAAECIKATMPLGSVALTNELHERLLWRVSPDRTGNHQVSEPEMSRLREIAAKLVETTMPPDEPERKPSTGQPVDKATTPAAAGLRWTTSAVEESCHDDSCPHRGTPHGHLKVHHWACREHPWSTHRHDGHRCGVDVNPSSLGRLIPCDRPLSPCYMPEDKP